MAQNIRGPAQILARIDSLISHQVREWCAGKIDYPPDCTVIRVFKKEKKCEIWAKNASMDSLRYITDISICSMDFEPGPKLRINDGKTPEGFYHGSFGYWSRYAWMWMELDEASLDDFGTPGTGSCFKICIEYPNNADRARSRSAGFGNPGGDICIHGNCVTAGCVSFTNRNFLPVYAFARHHNTSRFGQVQVHIYPFDFDAVEKKEWDRLASSYTHSAALSVQKLIEFWHNLKVGHQVFNENKKVLQLKIGSGTVSPGWYCHTINALKTLLKTGGDYNGEVNSLYSSDLVPVIRLLQRRYGLAVDGAIGPATLRALAGNNDIPAPEYQFK